MPDRRSFLAASLGALLAACGSASTRLAAGTNPTETLAPAAGATTSGPTTSDASTSAGATTTGAAGAAPNATAAVPQVLRFSGPAVGGGTINAAAYVGRPVAFWFWAPG